MLKNQCLDGLRCFSVNFKYTVHKTIIFRYLFRELITPFFLGLSVFIFILIMSQILRLNELIIVYGVGIGTVLRLMFYLLIGFLAISIPIALLFSVLMVFGRLSSDSEITALKASGFSILQLAMPVLLFSVIVSAIDVSKRESKRCNSSQMARHVISQALLYFFLKLLKK